MSPVMVDFRGSTVANRVNSLNPRGNIVESLMESANFGSDTVEKRMNPVTYGCITVWTFKHRTVWTGDFSPPILENEGYFAHFLGSFAYSTMKCQTEATF